MNRRLLIMTLTAGAAASAAAPEPAFADEPTRSPQELNLNAFRNPSIGIEYRRDALAAHAGLYPTVISKDQMGVNETSWFVRAGASYFFLPRSWYGQRPSEWYVSASYLRGLNLDHGNAALFEAGYRWMIWSGLNVRIGVATLLERHHDVKVNPTPGIGWSASW
ncbi:MAG: hypothetical protein AB7P03_03385 [Kofleriaceae bacterium]